MRFSRPTLGFLPNVIGKLDGAAIERFKCLLAQRILRF
jgi:hypothetical protein